MRKAPRSPSRASAFGAAAACTSLAQRLSATFGSVAYERTRSHRLAKVTPTATLPVYSVTPPSLSRIFPPTVRVPALDVAHEVVELVPNAPYPEPSPQSNAYVNPAAVSAADGSLGLVSASANGKPANAWLGAANVAVGATLVICTVACATAVRPPSSVTRTFTMGEAGPSAAANVTACPAVSNVPLPSRSQA